MTIMTQFESVGPQYSYANRYIHNVDGVTITANFSWRENGWSAAPLMRACGVCVFAYYPQYNGITDGTGNDSAPFNNINTTWGCWHSGGSIINIPWIGASGYGPLWTGPSISNLNSYSTSVVITVGPNLGGDLFDVTMRLIIASEGIDHTETELAVIFPEGHAYCGVGGNFLSDVNNTMVVNTLSIVEV